jgi:hypothetical protein
MLMLLAKNGPAESSNRIKNQDARVTDEEMARPPESHLQTLAEEAHESVQLELRKAELRFDHRGRRGKFPYMYGNWAR